MEKNLSDFEVFVFDLDGTLYLGENVLPGAHEIIDHLEKTGKKYIYLTNNSSRAASDYVERLRNMGFPCRRENVLSSGMATGEYLMQNYSNSRVYPVGTAAFEAELASYGVNLVKEDADVVCVGFDTELNYEKLKNAVHFLRRGAYFIAANPDWVCPMPNDEVLPDCGSICALLTASTGKEPFYIGKPNRSMIDIVSKNTGVPNEKILCIGDRLYTDIAVGINASAGSALVLSGETTREMLEASPIDPDFVFDSVLELLVYLKRKEGL